VGDIEQASGGADSEVFFGQGCVLHRELEAGELNHATAGREVLLI
jgi:hypothetical protein